MNTAQTDKPAKKPLRLWPGVVVVVLQFLVRFVVPMFVPGGIAIGMIGGLLGGLLVVLWWVFLSRAPRFERWGGIVLMIAAVAATYRILHKSVATGMMGFMFYLYVTPVLSLAFVAWAVATHRLSSGVRRASMVAAILLACGVFALLRTGGMTGDADSDFHWRWAQTPEQRLLAQSGEQPAPIRPASIAVETNSIWPGFRGPDRDGIIRGVRISTNWSASPPVQLWRRPIGPAWSSFAVRGDLLYTQEQRGEEEVVACYNVSTGQPVWRHQDAARFWESNAGAGPRATPTLSNGRLYTLGGTGILNALNATDGGVVWSRNAASDTGAKIPGWGFAGSPLVADDLVIVATAGTLIAYDLTNGSPRWIGPKGGGGYSSPHLSNIGGVKQVLLLKGAGLVSVAPDTGNELWNYPWPGDGIVQPALTVEGDILLGAGTGMGSGAKLGVRRIAVAHGPAGWTAEERWSSIGLKPYFNDIVVHQGHAFGFDGGFLACIDLKDGKRKWKGGRYGYGQMILLADQDLLVVLSEQGELALVSAASDQYTELARFRAVEGKTWNHPVLVGDVLLARNSEEMVAFRLVLAGR